MRNCPIYFKKRILAYVMNIFRHSAQLLHGHGLNPYLNKHYQWHGHQLTTMVTTCPNAGQIKNSSKKFAKQIQFPMMENSLSSSMHPLINSSLQVLVMKVPLTGLHTRQNIHSESPPMRGFVKPRINMDASQ